jgi:hypothetical protein
MCGIRKAVTTQRDRLLLIRFEVPAVAVRFLFCIAPFLLTGGAACFFSLREKVPEEPASYLIVQTWTSQWLVSRMPSPQRRRELRFDADQI